MLSVQINAISRFKWAGILLAAVLAACEQGASLEELISAGKAHLERGEYQAAIIEFKNALQKNSESKEARGALAQAYVPMGELSSAEKEIEIALELGLKSVAADRTALEVMLLLGKYDAVLTKLKEPLLGLDEATKLTYKGRALMGLRQLRESQALLEQAVLADGDSLEARVALTLLLTRRRRYDEAQIHAQAAVDIAPNSAKAWRAYGDLALVQKEPELALERAKKALEAENAHTQSLTRIKRITLIRLAKLHLMRKEPLDALKSINEVGKYHADSFTVGHVKAVVAVQLGQEQKARVFLREVLARAPNYPPALLLLGLLHVKVGELGQAKELAERLVSRRPESVQAHKLLGEVFIRLNEPQNAIAAMLPLARKALEDEVYISRLTEALNATGNHTQAVELLEIAARNNPDHSGSRRKLAFSQLASGDSAAALATLDEFAIRAPTNRQAQFMRALVHMRVGNLSQAREIADALERLDPTDTTPGYIRARSSMLELKLDAVKAELAKVHVLDPKFVPGYVMLASIAMRQREFDNAQRYYDKILELAPGNAAALTGLAFLANQKGETDEALKLLEEASEVNANSIQPRLVLAEYYLNRNQTEEAAEITEEARSILPDNPSVLAAYGSAMLSSGKPRKALEAFTRLVEVSPRPEEAWLYVAHARGDLGDYRQAKAALRKAVERNPKFLAASTALAELELLTGRPEAAIQVSNRLTEEFPESGNVQIIRGRAFLALGKGGEALSAFRNAHELRKSTDSILGYSRSLRATGDADKADALLATWLQGSPNDLKIKAEAASVALRAGNVETAVREFEAIRAVRQHIPLVNRSLAMAYASMGDDRAIILAEQAYSDNQRSPLSAATLGWILLHDNDRAKEGTELLAKAYRDAPGNSAIRYFFAASLARSGDVKTAKQHLEELLSSARNFPMRGSVEKLLGELNLL